MFKAVAALQAVVLANDEWFARVNGVLRTHLLACATANASIGDLVALGLHNSVAHGEIFPRDGAGTEAEILDCVVLDDKHSVDVLGLARIDVL